jgi:excisionase family DNA binding protein
VKKLGALASQTETPILTKTHEVLDGWGLDRISGRPLRPGEAAGAVGCSVKTILRAIKAGELQALPLNRRVILITKVDLAAYVATKAARRMSSSGATAGCNGAAAGKDRER